MKYKLIAGAIASVLTIGGLAVLPFKEVNIDPQIESINNSTTIVSKAKGIIEKLGNNVTELSNRNKELVIENENLKKEINNGSGDSEISYENPSNNPDVVLGKAGGEEFKSFVGAKVYTPYIWYTISNYYKIKCSKQFIAFYNYMLVNNICYKGKNELQNIKIQRSGLSSLNNIMYADIAHGGYQSTFYNYLDAAIDNKNKNTIVVPENERKELENISLEPELQSKLNKCFSVFLNYCQNHDLKISDTNSLNTLIYTYNELMANKYLKEFFTYLYNNPELFSTTQERNENKSKMTTYSNNYNSYYKTFNTNLDKFIEKYEK